MTVRNDPSALRWLIGSELKRHREHSKTSLDVAAKRLSRTAPKVYTMESGKYRQNPTEVARLLELYGADPDTIDRLVSLSGQDDTDTWWAPWSDLVPDWLRTFVGLEGLAEDEFAYEPVVLHAMLQTESYAAALAADARRVRPDHADRIVEFRLERQRRLTEDESPLCFGAVIEESALHRPIGGPKTMRSQLDHLLEVAELDNVTVQVVPTSVGMHAGYAGQFTLLGFAEFQDIAYIELQEGSVYLQEAPRVRSYKLAADGLHHAALGHHDSAALIAEVIKEL